MVASRHEAPEDPPGQKEDDIPDVIDPWGRRHPVESERFVEQKDGTQMRYVKYKDGTTGSSLIVPIKKDVAVFCCSYPGVPAGFCVGTKQNRLRGDIRAEFEKTNTPYTADNVILYLCENRLIK